VHRRRPGHRGDRRARLIGPLVGWLDRLLGRAGAARPRPSSEPAHIDALERALDRSGWVREAAVRELGDSPRPEAIRVLLVRANDWVPQVRAAAAAALTRHLRDDFLPAWAAAIDAVDALRSARRVDRAALLAPIDAFLAAPERLERLVQDTRAAPIAHRRIVGAMRRAAAADPAALARLLAADAAGADVVAALAATRAAAGLVNPALRGEVWRAAAGSPHAAVRLAAIADIADALGRARADTAPRPALMTHAALIERFAFDPSAAVRARILSAADPFERDAIAALSRQQLAAPASSRRGSVDRPRSIALHNLIALDTADAAERCAASVAAAGALERAVAFAGCWSRADPAAREKLLIAAFADAAARVQRWAVRAVARGGLVPPWRELLAILVRAPAPSRLAAVRRALGHASPWWRLAFELALGAASGRYDGAALARWCGDVDRSYAAPPLAEADALAAAWRNASPHLDPAIVRAVGARLVRFGVIAD
jgi:hypothetical protein